MTCSSSPTGGRTPATCCAASSTSRPGPPWRTSRRGSRSPPRRRGVAQHGRSRDAAGTTRRAALAAADVRELSRDFDVGFHTLEHHYLPSLDDDELRAAMHDGRDDLEAAAGRPIHAIAYPHGGTDERTAAAAHAAGFALGLTTEPRRLGADPLRIGRVEPASPGSGRFALAIERALARRP
jgi:peptidoglycan/xylan/chitin deacetylase (PgdA/CDA1 family)